MSVDQNKAVVYRFYEELWNDRDLGVAEEIIAVDCVTHQLQSGAEPVAAPRGPDAVRRHVAEWLTGFPDLRFTVEGVIAEGNQVMTRSVMRGTHTGTWLGIPPTGKQISIRMTVVQRVLHGKIAEDWVLVEALGFFQQLGLIPTTPEILTKAAK